jgi:glycerophosphoryl diester phosphodiesterase
MSDAQVKKEKKKWSKKKKILVIVFSVIFALLLLVFIAGLGVLHWYCTTVDYEVVSASEIANENTKIIGHRGFRAIAPENTLPSFEKAGENGFWGSECDIYRTSDGVWVVQHDVNTYRMMDFTKSIEKCTYEELLEHNTDNGNNIEDYPNLKICTLDEFLQACQDYNMTAVIELKGKNNTEHYDEIIDTISNYSCDVTFISFHEENLKKLRELSDAPMFYLCYTIDDEAIEIAKSIENCGLDFDASKKGNFKDDAKVIKQAQSEGLTLGAWTIDDLDTAETLINLGIDYITTDCITY